jgi:hypothetical protein
VSSDRPDLAEALAVADRAILLGLVLACDLPTGERFTAFVEDLSQLLDRFASACAAAGLPNAEAATENARMLREVVERMAPSRHRRHLSVVRGG